MFTPQRQRNFAGSLRQNQTDAESIFWYHLRSRRFFGLKFKRQHALGPYIVDFVCLEKQLIVELDGGQHAAQVRYDQRRDQWLKGQGFLVIRYWNNQVIESLPAVLEDLAGRCLGES
ncbi:endonuclease domain-containing protein [Andreprevotia chitinilytica]|uniref:endonuclease domain-containing protein n=1 Tax=Andreprevotia chitinilytica TaxID=396808 RepID=UPI000557785F|nr:endonuclease domain-containing protein [Andreprevotia chitinilytica]